MKQPDIYLRVYIFQHVLVHWNRELVKNYTGGVFYDTTNTTEIDHDISVVGYGIDKVSML